MIRRFFLSLALLLAGTALSSPPGWSADATVRVEDPWVRVTFGQSRVTAGYLTLVDLSGKGNSLIAVEMADGIRAGLHETVTEGDVVKMRMTKALPLPPGGKAKLTPAGGHIMIMGLKAPLKVGEHLPATLKFADGSELQVDFEVRTH